MEFLDLAGGGDILATAGYASQDEGSRESHGELCVLHGWVQGDVHAALVTPSQDLKVHGRRQYQLHFRDGGNGADTAVRRLLLLLRNEQVEGHQNSHYSYLVGFGLIIGLGK